MLSKGVQAELLSRGAQTKCGQLSDFIYISYVPTYICMYVCVDICIVSVFHAYLSLTRYLAQILPAICLLTF